ncbi:MAG TPA: hypothetical protein VMI72_19390 [Roseiarcus sp.]|nr:hypothetical protein [Roseiarcus sp.]
MSSKVGSNEIRVLIRPVEAPGFEPELIPAPLFKKVFDSFLSALLAADREIHAKSVASQFYVSYLDHTTRQFGIIEKQRSAVSAIDFIRKCCDAVRRSEYDILLRHQRLMRAFHRIAKALNSGYSVVVQCDDAEFPFDGVFCRQVHWVGSGGALSQRDGWAAGSATMRLEGRLEAVDYRGPSWRGRLTLADGVSEIECVFDRSMGEDALNPFGHKCVCVTGRAIYTGDSKLPERIEVMTIEEAQPGPGGGELEGQSSPDENHTDGVGPVGGN